MSNSYTPVESNEYPNWFLIPNVEGYLASRDGFIMRLDNGYKTRGGFTGHYLRVYIHGKQKYAHALICSAFHGPRPSKFHECNHDDGDKTNNNETNLYWTTKNENVQHAYDNGLNTVLNERPLHVVDVLNKITYYPNSIADAEKMFASDNFSRSGIFNAIKHGYAYKNRWAIFDSGLSDDEVYSKLSEWVIMMEAVSRKITLFHSVKSLSNRISKPTISIIDAIDSKRQVVGKYLVKSLYDETEWLPRDAYLEIYDGDHKHVKVYEFETGRCLIFDSARSLAEYYNVAVNTVVRRCKSGNQNLTDGLLVKFLSDKRPFKIGKG